MFTRHQFPVFLLIALLSGLSLVSAQTPSPDPDANDPGEAPKQVDVQPVSQDEQIAQRLQRILEATGWFEEPDVTVDEGVVFLEGAVNDAHHKDWASQLARNTQDVVAVVNQMTVKERPIWDLSPSMHKLRQLAVSLVRGLPLLIMALLLLALTLFATRWTISGASRLLEPRISSTLLRDVTARTIGVPVFILGLYVLLKVSDLTGLAMTVLGGTGLIGLIIGFAFRDIAENFLASLLISMQNPFARGDLIEVAGYKGFVQSVNTRSTLLMTLEGNHIQIPNATIYKEPILNLTANPFTRFYFDVGIGYDDSITRAQEVAMQVLKDHPAVVNEPEPMVLAENLGAATIVLRVFFWVDVNNFSGAKVRSAILRLVKNAFVKAGISMPDEAREVVFPQGVPVQMLPEAESTEDAAAEHSPPVEEDADTNSGEGELSSEADVIRKQAEQSRKPEEGQDLLGS